MATEYLTETVFTWGAPPLKFGVGAIDEIGFDCGQLGLSRVLIVTDEGVAATGIPERAADSMRGAGLKPTVFTGVHVEPTDDDFPELDVKLVTPFQAAAVARDGRSGALPTGRGAGSLASPAAVSR